MKTEFFDIIEKSKLLNEVSNGNQEAIKTLFNEIARLEGVIKDYEIGVEIIITKYEERIFKTPNRFKEVENG